MQRTVLVAGRKVKLTNLEKEFWPESGLRKADLVAYFHQVADYLLPHLRGRPLVVTRYPDGVAGKSFYQKNLPEHTPDWVARVAIFSEHSDRTINYCLVEEAATLVWLGNQGGIELHPWFSRINSLDKPDLAVIDLDPAPPAGFEEARQTALLVKKLLDKIGLKGFPKTSGATGIHIMIPVQPLYEYDLVRLVMERIGAVLLRTVPDLVTMERQVNKRNGKVYIDYLQNIRGKTVVSAYSPRPLPGAPVSTPCTWEEVGHIQPQAWNIRSVIDRLKQQGDPHADIMANQQRLEMAQKALGIKI
ncbi:MAG TPA: DNA polymerase domain-containing protein [Firmicutes bacterium]|jgi:bifunctional non-homologous end joining protein LigD|nr:DNA polymerase domain-containing protein [Bacillota bacterium]